MFSGTKHRDLSCGRNLGAWCGTTCDVRRGNNQFPLSASQVVVGATVFSLLLKLVACRELPAKLLQGPSIENWVSSKDWDEDVD